MVGIVTELHESWKTAADQHRPVVRTYSSARRVVKQ